MARTAPSRNPAGAKKGVLEEYWIVSFDDPNTGEALEFDLYCLAGMFSTAVVRMLIALGYDPQAFDLDHLWNMATLEG